MSEQKAINTPVSLYPEQRAIIEAFAAESGRSFSNAVQFIIEDWARISGFAAKLEAARRKAQKSGKLTSQQQLGE